MMAERGGLEPVNRESTAGIIARQLRTAVMYGTFAPGSQLGEAELAAQFHVSRGSLREAMQRLVAEGLLRGERHRGLFVITLGPDEVRDIYTARTAVEHAAGGLILRGDNEGAADRLEAVVQQMADAAGRQDYTAMSDADLSFHEALVAESGSPRLIRMHGTLLVETRMCMTALQGTYPVPDDLVAEHTRIIAAIRAGDDTQLSALIDAHTEDALRRLAPSEDRVVSP